MNTMSDEEKLKLVTTAPKLDAKGFMTITLNGHTTKTEKVAILDDPAKGFLGFVGEGKDMVIVQFSSLTESGAYDVKKYKIWIYMAFSGFVGQAETGDLTLETFDVRAKHYKGHFDVKTKDHQKVDGVFDVQES